jgi:carbonic anhydrase
MPGIPDSNSIIQELKEGNRRFLDGKSVQSSDLSLKKLKEFARLGQLPKAIVLCCSDSRAPVEMIFDQDIGDLFVIRVAGNIIAPSLVGSVEFAASTYGVNTVLVMGHSKCGAVLAALEQIENPQTVYSENIHDIVSRIKPHIYPISQIRDMTHQQKYDLAVRTNVMASVSELSVSSRLIEGLVHDNKLTVYGAVLELDTGAVEFLAM